MADVGSFKSSRYLTQFDCEPPLVVTIASVEKEMVGQGQDAQEKPVMKFSEQVKPWVCGIQSLEIIASIPGFGTNTDAWIGKKIELYREQNIMFGGKRTGGIRPRPVSANTGVSIPEAAPLQPGENWTMAQAVEQLAAFNIDKSVLYGELRKAGLKQWNAPVCVPIAKRLIQEAVEAANSEPPPEGDEVPF